MKKAELDTKRHEKGRQEARKREEVRIINARIKHTERKRANEAAKASDEAAEAAKAKSKQEADEINARIAQGGSGSRHGSPGGSKAPSSPRNDPESINFVRPRLDHGDVIQWQIKMQRKAMGLPPDRDSR